MTYPFKKMRTISDDVIQKVISFFYRKKDNRTSTIAKEYNLTLSQVNYIMARHWEKQSEIKFFRELEIRSSISQK